MKETQIAAVTQEVLRALSFLHSKGIYRDIKSEIVFLGIDGTVNGTEFVLCKYCW